MKITKQSSNNQVSSHYNIGTYKLSSGFIRDVTKLHPVKTYWTLCSIWLSILGLIFATRFLLPKPYFWFVYIPVIFLIAGRQGALLQLVHEAAHRLFAATNRKNNFLAKWLCALPLGVNFEGYVKGHRLHHAHTNTDLDPPADTEKYRQTNVKKPELYRLLLKDLCGLTALGVFFAYKRDGDRSSGQGPDFSGALVNYLCLCFVQILVLGVLFQFDLIGYTLLWIVPAMSPHMFLMRIRGIAEHGLSKQLGISVQRRDQGVFHTRSFLTQKNRYRILPLVWLEKILIGSLDVYYHHEHHLLPNVPFYNLKKVHDRLADQVAAKNPEVYSRGYVAAAMRNIMSRP